MKTKRRKTGKTQNPNEGATMATKFVKGKQVSAAKPAIKKASSNKSGAVEKSAPAAPEKKPLARPAPAAEKDVAGFGAGVPKPEPRAAKPKPVKVKRVTAMSRTVELVLEKKYTDKEMDAIIAKEFPDRTVGAPTWSARKALAKNGTVIPALRRDENDKIVPYYSADAKK